MVKGKHKEKWKKSTSNVYQDFTNFDSVIWVQQFEEDSSLEPLQKALDIINQFATIFVQKDGTDAAYVEIQEMNEEHWSMCIQDIINVVNKVDYD